MILHLYSETETLLSEMELKQSGGKWKGRDDAADGTGSFSHAELFCNGLEIKIPGHKIDLFLDHGGDIGRTRCIVAGAIITMELSIGAPFKS